MFISGGPLPESWRAEICQARSPSQAAQSLTFCRAEAALLGCRSTGESPGSTDGRQSPNPKTQSSWRGSHF